MLIQENIKEIAKYAQMQTVQLVAACVLSLVVGFSFCKYTSEPCVTEIVCKEIIEDRDKVSLQLKEERKKCLDEKAELGKSLKGKLIKQCNEKIKEAIKDCDFSEKHHCPICKARGICK